MFSRYFLITILLFAATVAQAIEAQDMEFDEKVVLNFIEEESPNYGIDGIYIGQLKTNILPSIWTPNDNENARYEVVILPEETEVEQCRYRGTGGGGGTLIRVKMDFTVTINNLETNESIAQSRFEGHTPPMCPPLITASRTAQKRYGIPDASDFRAWLLSIMEENTSLPIPIILFGHEQKISDSDLSPDGKIVVTVEEGEDATIRFWDLSTKEQTLAIDTEIDNISRVQFHPDGGSILATDCSTLLSWDVETGDKIDQISLSSTLGIIGCISVANYSLSGDQIVVGTEEGEVAVITPEGSSVLKIDSFYSKITDAVFGLDGNSVAVANDDLLTEVWQINEASLLFDLFTNGNYVKTILYSSDGTGIYTSSLGGSTELWDSETGHIIFEIRGCCNVSLNPEKRLIMAGENIYSNDSNELLYSVTNHLGVVDQYFGFGGEYIITISDKTILLWDAETGEPLIKD